MTRMTRVGTTLGVLKKSLKHPAPQPFAAMVEMDNDIAEPGVCTAVGDRSRQTNLTRLMKEANAHRMAYGNISLLASAVCCPIGGLQKRDNRINVELRRIIGQ